MKIKDLKEIIKDLPDEMPFILLDISTDNSHEGDYSINKKSFDLVDLSTNTDGVDVSIIQGLALCFKKTRNGYVVTKIK